MAVNPVRMSGFRTRSTVEEAWSWCDAAVAAMGRPDERVSLTAAHDRCLAQDITSRIDVPGFDRSAMDGYAVIADETNGASDYSPVRLKLVGEAMPGSAFPGKLGPSECVRIMTGAPIPNGATAVVPVEYTQPEGGAVLISTTVGEAKHIGRKGEDIRIGATVLQAGRLLRPQDVAVIASLGLAEVVVRQRPKVRLIITGNELVMPGEVKNSHQIYEANSSLLIGAVARDGGELESIRFVEDREEAIREALLEPGADVILISGGSSVGAEDFAPGIVAEHGELAIHGVAMRPSSPTGLGKVNNALVVLLPGNPVSCLCAYDFFAGRIIRRLAGAKSDWPFQRLTTTLAKKMVSAIGRVDYCRVQIRDGAAIPLAISGASILSSTTRADGFVVVPADSEGLCVGSVVEVLLYGEFVDASGRSEPLAGVV